MVSDTDSILVVTQYFPPETGAAQTRWDELTKRWSEDTSVTVLTSAPDYPEGEVYDGYDNRWLRSEQRGDVEVLYTKTLTSSSGNLLRRSLKFVWFMLISLIVGLRYTSPSTVIATSPQPLTGVSAWIIARIRRATFVFEIRDLWPESISAISDFDNRVVIGALDWTIVFLYHRSDHLIVVTQAFVDPITDRDVDRSKISYHPNGITPSFYQTDEDAQLVIEALEETFTVTYAGTIGRAHGLSVVLEAAPQLDNAQFMLVGDGAERKALEKKAASYDNVIFAGRYPKENIPDILTHSDVTLVHLQPREIFNTALPSKLLEAMAAELPVILGVNGEAERVLAEANAGISIEPGDGNALADAVTELQENPEMRRDYAMTGRKYVMQQFNWDTIAADYLETIRSNQD